MKRIILYWAIYGFIELIIYVWLFKWLGFLPLLLIQVLSTALGIYMIKKLGANFLFNLRDGRTVAPYLLDGICYIFAAIGFIIPGIMTTVCALFLFIPFVRNLIKPKLTNWLNKKSIKNTHIYFDM
ncbi:FxsA family protein [Listeria sp. PSOL-1]|uniref:FxsA family protein n=1 Tax=Listeria sp. PSOL-1 TaxID=1844999 RepID=UPI0013D0F805|nr:FxsA family protein [Listeria sp. PSOL-1]